MPAMHIRIRPIGALPLALLLLAGCGSAPKPGSAEAAPAQPETAPQPSATPAPAAPTPAAEGASAHAAPDQEFQPALATGAVKGVPAPTNTAPIVAVANYFTEFAGLDVAALPTAKRERFLQAVNSELCPCGCKTDTLARCYVNDPRCPVVKGIVQKLYQDVRSGP